jgi:hypothetical protein
MKNKRRLRRRGSKKPKKIISSDTEEPASQMDSNIDHSFVDQNSTIDLVSVSDEGADNDSESENRVSDSISDSISYRLERFGLLTFLQSKQGGALDIKLSRLYINKLVHYLKFFLNQEGTPRFSSDNMALLIQNGFESMPKLLASYLQNEEIIGQYAPDTIRLALEKLLTCSRWYFLFLSDPQSSSLSDSSKMLLNLQMTELSLRLRRQYKKASNKLKKVGGKDTMEYKVGNLYIILYYSVLY